MWRFLAFVALVVAPGAAAAPSIDALQEPIASSGASGAVAEFTMTPSEAARVNYIVFRMGTNTLMAAKLVDERGTTVWEIPEATNGVQPFARNATAGYYKLVLRGNGQVQVLHRILAENASATLDGTHAYLLVPPEPQRVAFVGDVRVEWTPLGNVPTELTPPANATAEKGHPHVVTLRGEAGSAYAITLAPTQSALVPPGDAQTPAGAGLALVALAALARLRSRRP